MKCEFKQTEIGMIPEDWELGKASDSIQLIGGGTPKTSNSNYWGGSIPWVSVVDFVRGVRWIYDTEKHITEEGLKNSSAKLLDKGQIIISARGTVGELGQAAKEMAFNQSCYGIDGGKVLDNDFLYYLLKHKVKDVQSKSHGSVFGTITRSTFEHILLPLPPLPEQRTIAKILSDLDSKTELLQQQNKTLEAIGQTLFKHWFVDFEFPNEEGKPYKSNGGKMVESELGDIPEGWGVGSYQDIVSVSTGKGCKKSDYVENGKYPILGANGVLGRTDEYLFDESLILTGRVGTLGTVYLYEGKNWISDNVLISKPSKPENYYYAYFTLLRFDFKSLNRGSTQPLITQTDLKNKIIILPENDVLKKFHKISCSLFHKINKNQKNILCLQKTRDLLLPKLMTGKIRVKV